MVELVSSNSDKDITKRRALEQIRSLLVELTANLLRITRGAGKAYDIAHQALELVKAFTAYQEAAGHLPSDYDLSRMLEWHDRDLIFRTDIPYEDKALDYARDRIADGVLQLVASRLIGQKLQEAAGRREMQEGLRDLRQAQDEIAKRYREQHRAAMAKPVRSRKRRLRPKKPTD